MTRTPNYKKWQAIYNDSKVGMTWNELVVKHKTSKRTVSKALKFFENVDDMVLKNINNIDLELILARKKINDLQEKINLLESNNKFIPIKREQFMENKDFSLNRTEQIIQIIQALQNTTRIRIMVILYIYNELSLSRLSKKLGISKSTVARHLKPLRKMGVINVREVKVRGPKLKQYFSATPDILELTRLSRSLLRTVSPKKSLDAHLAEIKSDGLVFSLIKKIINEIIIYYDEFRKEIQEFRPQDHQTIEELFSTVNTGRYYLWIFDREQFKLFRNKYREFFNDLRKHLKELEAKRDKIGELEKPFFIWHMVIPIQKVFDFE